MTTRLSFSKFHRAVAEMFGPKASLIDSGEKGVLDPKDKLVRVIDGKSKTVALGKTRYQQAEMQLLVARAAYDFHAEGIDFAQRKGEWKVNQKLWWVGYAGQMGVRYGVRPSEALADIFKNGHLYGMECATATMVVLHKAILDRIGPDDFDKAFPRLQLYRWNKQDDDFLAVKRSLESKNLWPGDHAYFANPDVHPNYRAFQGENVIYLGDDKFFGHGMGVMSRKQILAELDSMRKAGAKKKAFLDPMRVRLDPKAAAKLDLGEG